MSTLNKLRVLNFDDNKLAWIPDCVKGLISVTTFSCKRNEILKLSIGTGNMVLIEQFSCDMNKIKVTFCCNSSYVRFLLTCC